MTQLSELPMRQFDRSLPMALLRAREAVMKKFSPALKEHGLSSQQWRVIRALVEEQALDATEISERCALLMPSLSRILQNLQKRGLIDRETASDDQRRSLVSTQIYKYKSLHRDMDINIHRHTLTCKKTISVCMLYMLYIYIYVYMYNVFNTCIHVCQCM